MDGAMGDAAGGEEQLRDGTELDQGQPETSGGPKPDLPQPGDSPIPTPQAGSFLTWGMSVLFLG